MILNLLASLPVFEGQDIPIGPVDNFDRPCNGRRKFDSCQISSLTQESCFSTVATIDATTENMGGRNNKQLQKNNSNYHFSTEKFGAKYRKGLTEFRSKSKES